jgi:hypothetical protein
MAITPKPNGNQMLTNSKQITPEQKAFISGAQADATPRQKTRPVMLRVEPDTLARIDRAAKRVGLKRAAFILSSAVERVDRMEQGRGADT